MQLKCPHCKAVHSVQDKQSMPTIRCQTCKKSIRIRESKEPTRTPSRDKKPPVREKKQPSNPIGLLLAGIGVCVFLALCAVTGVGALILFRMKDRPEDKAVDVAQNHGDRRVAPPDKEPKNFPIPEPKKEPDPELKKAPDQKQVPKNDEPSKDLQQGHLPKGAIVRLGSSQFSHGGDVKAIAYSPDGEQLASAGQNKLIHVWNTRTGEEMITLSGHKHGVRGVAFLKSADGKPPTELVSASLDKTIRVWDLTKGTEKKVIELTEACAALALSPDGQSVAIATGIPNPEVRVYTLADGVEQLRWKANSGGTSSMVFSPDGKTIFAGGNNGASSGVKKGDDYALAAWDTATGKNIHAFAGHTSHVGQVVVSPDGAILASIGSDLNVGTSVRLWDAKTFKELHHFKDSSFSLRNRTVALSPDGKVVVGISPEKIHFWEVATGKYLTPVSKDFNEVGCVAFHPKGESLVLAGESGVLSVWNRDKSQWRKRESAGHSLGITAMAVSPDGKNVLTASGDNRIFLWDVKSAQVVHTLKNPATRNLNQFSQAVFSPEGKTVVVAANFSGAICWDTEQGFVRKHLGLENGIGPRIVSVAVSADNKYLAGELSDSPEAKLWDAQTGAFLRSFPRKGRGVAAGFSGDGKKIAVAADELAVYDITTAMREKSFPLHLATSVAFTRDLKRIAVSSGFEVRVLDVDKKGAQTAVIFPEVPGKSFHGIAFSPDEQFLAVCQNQKISIRDPWTGHEAHAFTGHSADVTCVAFNREGNLLVSASLDCTAFVWDMTKVPGFKKK